MLARALRTAKRLRQDQRGFSIVEFAFVAPIFGVMLVGVAELARGYSERFALQQAANRTLELAQLERRTLQTSTETRTFAYLIPEAAAAAGVPESAVTLQSWLECDTTRKTWDETCAENEQIARYITLTIDSTFTPSFGSSLFPGVSAAGTVPIRASASLRVQ